VPIHRLLLQVAVSALLAGCLYDFKNPAEVLGSGEASGRVVADRTASGVLEPFPGVSVSLKGASFDQTTHESGRFAVLGLPVGRHTLLFRKGTVWSLERDLEVAFGRDGQPEGVDLGQVELRYGATVEGTFAILPGNDIAKGVVVDETTGLTAALLPDPTTPNQATFRFQALNVGTHLLKVGARDASLPVAGLWVGGQAPVTITESDQTKVVPVGADALTPHLASGSGHIRFRIQEVGDTTAVMSAITATLVGELGTIGPFTPDSAGYVDQDVPEGAWRIVLSGGGLAGAPIGPTSALLATAPGAPLKPPVATAVVLAGRYAEVGSVYVVSDLALALARVACAIPADCGKTPCVAGSCGDYSAPGSGSAGANLPFCTGCTFNEPNTRNVCRSSSGAPGRCTCPVSDPLGAICPQLPPTPSACDPGCGSLCTTDGAATLGFLPPAGGC
jgi:hypothetical protein